MLESPAIIIPRNHLLFLTIDVTQVPQTVRASFLSQRVKQVSPFRATGRYTLIENGIAQLWIWDKEKTDKFQSQQELVGLPCIPEILFYTPIADGYRVQACLVGWELQCWESSVLMQSRWYSALPCEQDMADFVRVSSGLNLEPLEWANGERVLLSKPYSEKPFWTKENLLKEEHLSKIIAGVLLAFLLFQLGLFLGVLSREAYTGYSVTHAQKALKERVQQRDAALEGQEFNRHFSAVIQSPSQLFILAQLNKCLDGQNYQLLDWQFQRGRLTLAIQQDQPNVRALVEECSKNALFTQIHTEPGSSANQTRMSMSVMGVANDEGGTNE